MSVITGLLVKIGVDNSSADRGLVAGARSFDRYATNVQRSGDRLGASMGRSGVEAANGWVRGADGRLRDAQGKFVSAGEQAGAGLGTGMSRGLGRTGSKLVSGASRLGRRTGLALGVGLVVVGSSSVQLESDFSQTMATIGASTGTAGQQLDGLGDLALDMGAKTSFSANEAADATLELAKGGLTAATIQAGALEGTLTLAAAGGTSLATAATIGSNALNAFNLSGRETDSVAAALAGGANASTASVESLGQALSQVGPGAVNAGLSLQETVGTLAAFDNAGIKGSDAGTSLKTMLTRLIPQTEKQSTAMDALGLSFVNSNGEIDSITTVAGKLQDKLGGLTQEQRTTALATIFGSDATRAATALMREGEGGIRKYIKATQDQGAAEEMAQARMSGTAGALERLSGASETARLRIGQEAAPAVVFLANKLGDNLVPATDATLGVLTSLWQTFDEDGIDGLVGRFETLTGTQGQLVPVVHDVIDAGRSLWTIFTNGLIPAFGDASALLPAVVQPLRLGADILGFFADNAGLTRVALAGYITYLGAAKIATIANTIATSSGVVAMRQYAAGTLTAGQMLGGFGGAARLAAGIGGMAAVTASAGSSNKALSTLGTIAGATATGFALGGPWGAAAGAVAGVGTSIYNLTKNSGAAETATQRLSDQQALARDTAADYAGTLDQVTGAMTQQTRATIFDELTKSGALAQARSLGIASRDVISAVMGQAGAYDRVRSSLQNATSFTITYRDAQGGLYTVGTRTKTQADQLTSSLRQQGFTIDKVAKAERDAAAKGQLLAAIGRETDATRASVAAQREKIRATQDLSSVQNKLPKQLVTKISSTGIEPTRKGIARLANDYDLTPKQVRTLITASGVTATVKQIRSVQTRLQETADTPGKLTRYGSDIRSSAAGASGFAREGGIKVRKGLEDPVKAARPDLGGFGAGISASIGPIRTTAAGGGVQIGGALKSGVISGFSGTASILASQAYSAVSQAVAAGRRAGKIDSPSKETHYTGRMLGRGLITGQDSQRKGVIKSGRNLVVGMLKGLSAGDTQLSKKLEGITKKIGNELEADMKKIDKLLEGKKISKTRAKRMREDATARARQGRSTVASITKEANALAATRSASTDLTGSVSSNIRSEFDLGALTSPEPNQFGFSAPVTFGTIQAGITSFVNRVKGFANRIGLMRKAGIPGGLINEVAGLGSVQGTKVADLLLSTSGSQKKWLQGAYGQIDTAAAAVGQQTAGAVYGPTLTRQQANVQRELNKARGRNPDRGGGGRGDGKRGRNLSDEDLDALARRFDERPIKVQTDVHLGGRKLATVHQAGRRALEDKK